MHTYSKTEIAILECLASHYSKEDILLELGITGTHYNQLLYQLRKKLLNSDNYISREDIVDHACLCRAVTPMFKKMTHYTFVS